MLWKCWSTAFLMAGVCTHMAQKQYSWRIYQRHSYRYWKKTW
jgi:hypothetical protein